MREFQAAFDIDPRSESPYQQFVGFAPLLDELAGRWRRLAQGSRLYPLLLIEPVQVLDDPNPFIGLIDPPPHLVLHLP